MRKEAASLPGETMPQVFWWTLSAGAVNSSEQVRQIGILRDFKGKIEL
jgi:hypothetical protein